MASGHGINGRVGRCYPFFAEFKECMVSDFSRLRRRKCNGGVAGGDGGGVGKSVGDDGRLPVTLTRPTILCCSNQFKACEDGFVVLELSLILIFFIVAFI